MSLTLSMMAAAGCTERTSSSPGTLVTGLYRVHNVALQGECATAGEGGDVGSTVVEVYDDGTFSVGLPSFAMHVASIRRPHFERVDGGYATAQTWMNDCGASIAWETFASLDGATLEITDITSLRQEQDCILLQTIPGECTTEAVYELELEQACESPCEIRGGGAIEAPAPGEPPDLDPLHCSCPDD